MFRDSMWFSAVSCPAARRIWQGLRAGAMTAGLVSWGNWGCSAPVHQSRRPVALEDASAAPAANGRGESDSARSTPLPEVSHVASPRRVEHSWMSLAEWRRRHEAQLHSPGRKRAQLVVLGDSIAEGWCGSDAFRRAFSEYEPLGLAVGGDQTQHLLWRIEQGILEGLDPRLALVLIGVNNLGNGFDPRQTSDGVRRVVEEVRERLPQTPVLLLSILPAGETEADSLRQSITHTNPLLERLAEPGQVFVEDVGSIFLGPEARIDPADMADFLHPTESGQVKLTAAVAPLVSKYARPR